MKKISSMEATTKWILFSLLITQILCQSVDQSFTPNIEASCKKGYMTINVYVNNLEYRGAVHSRDFRKPDCMTIGDGSGSVSLSLPLITDEDDPQYCGVRVNGTNKEKYVPVAVRIHEYLELADDKFYVIRCGLQGFRNLARNESSFVALKLLDMDHMMTKEAVLFRKYILKADISGPDKTHTMRVKNCFSFGDPNYTLPLTDDRGCPIGDLITPFVYNDTAGLAEATLNQMFKFPNTTRVHFQCDVLICKVGECETERCAGRPERLTVAQPRAITDNSLPTENKSGMVQATTTVYVVDSNPSVGCPDCDWYPPWLWILCIVLAVLFIIMMIINIFLCSAMTCSCTKTEVIEKEPSIIEEYNPYRSWHGSQYGSKYSLNGKGYTSGASTMNSARSVSSHSDHYAIVHSRPHSRYSGHHSLKHEKPHHHHRDHHHHSSRGPPSTTGSHYSSKY